MNHKIYIPTGNRVLFEAPPKLTASDGDTKIGDLVIPPEAAERMMQAAVNPYVEVKVVAVGPECKLVQKGDLVVINRHHVSAMNFPNMKDVSIMAETELLAVLRDE